MALIKCKECGIEISDEATSCPGCGKPGKRTKQKQDLFLGIISVLLVGSVGFVGFFYSFCHSKESIGVGETSGYGKTIYWRKKLLFLGQFRCPYSWDKSY